jgi:hypothetical protein
MSNMQIIQVVHMLGKSYNPTFSLFWSHAELGYWDMKPNSNSRMQNTEPSFERVPLKQQRWPRAKQRLRGGDAPGGRLCPVPEAADATCC